MSNNIPNQGNFQDSQNFEIDINNVYSDFITAIDKIRSYANTSGISNQNAISAFSAGDPTLAKLKSQVLTSPTIVQESRCHAFLRIIGFPVVASNKSDCYNPGHDIIYDKTRIIGAAVSDKKLSIASSPITGFRNLSLQRESYVSNILNIFSVPQSIDAGALDLSVIARLSNSTPFSIPVVNSPDPFDTVLKNQQYKADLTGQVGPNATDFLEYVDVSGFLPTPSNLVPQRFHIIKPFIVDPVIDFTVNDAFRRVAVPFVPAKNFLMVKSNVFVNRPLLEQVITDRFTVDKQADSLGTADQSLINYVKNIPAIKNNKIISQISQGDVYKLSEQTQFVKFINIIRNMINKLLDAQQTIQGAMEKYYWVPIPSTSGPEQGSTVQGVFFSTDIPTDFITTADQAIIDAKIRVTVNQINAQTAKISGIPDRGGFAFDNFKTTFGPDTSGALGDISAQSLTKLVNSRSSDLTKANDALRTVEIIMGEFSGLGLCDIIAIMASLYIMPKTSLLGFLDPDALNRMNTALNLSESSPGVQKAMTDLTSTVTSFYNLMDQLYQGALQDNES